MFYPILICLLPISFYNYSLDACLFFRDIKGAHIEERNMWSISEELREVKMKSECTVLNCILTKQNTCLKNSAFNKNHKSKSVKIKHYFGWQFLFHFFLLVWGCLKEYIQNTESLLESEPKNIILLNFKTVLKTKL